jgi:tetratricopeptide (TPR) repeat protein
MNNSLYYEFYKQWKQSNYKSDAWKDAVKPWRWVFLNCPKSTKNIYLHGENLLDNMIKHESDKEKKEKLIDTLMMIYDHRIQYFGSEGYVLGKKGSDLYKLRPEAYEESYEILKRSIEIEGNESNGPVLIYYFRSAEKMVKNEKVDAGVLVDIYDQTSGIIEYNLNKSIKENKESEITNWENVKGNIELSFEPWATCPELIRIYTVKFNESPDNIELLRKITKILDKTNCTDSDLFLQALQKLVQIEPEPSAKSAELLGKLYIKREQYEEATKYLLQAADLCTDNNDKADIHYLLANVFFQMKQLSTARAQCYEVIKIKPNDGKAYILIGDLYSSSAKQCGEDDLTNKVAYWAAVDKYFKAKSVDSTVAELATTKINTFKQYFPSKETIFFYDKVPGEPYTVECWINETTTVRTSD